MEEDDARDRERWQRVVGGAKYQLGYKWRQVSNDKLVNHKCEYKIFVKKLVNHTLKDLFLLFETSCKQTVFNNLN